MSEQILKDENDVQQAIQIAGPGLACQLMRNNSGAMTDLTGRSVRFGLGNVSKKHSDNIKSSDLIGFTRVTITREMVGHTVAIFTAIEVKAPDWKGPSNAREQAQWKFITWVLQNGGIAGFAKSVEMFRAIIGR